MFMLLSQCYASLRRTAMPGRGAGIHQFESICDALFVTSILRVEKLQHNLWTIIHQPLQGTKELVGLRFELIPGVALPTFAFVWFHVLRHGIHIDAFRHHEDGDVVLGFAGHGIVRHAAEVHVRQLHVHLLHHFALCALLPGFVHVQMPSRQGQRASTMGAFPQTAKDLAGVLRIFHQNSNTNAHVLRFLHLVATRLLLVWTCLWFCCGDGVDGVDAAVRCVALIHGWYHTLWSAASLSSSSSLFVLCCWCLTFGSNLVSLVSSDTRCPS
mmetsp:Transcript_6381/g.17405  ORF Transcript_6381/g.17405 Transcript_6381/m.17405 type:complete len:270 (+) Transcript_6381:181-990(+)